MKKIPPSQKIRKEIKRIVEEGTSGEGSVLDALLEEGTKLVIQELLEGEVTEHLERGYYERSRGESVGYRNGYKPGRIKTAEGEIRSCGNFSGIIPM
jgi:transposase-like protein